MHKMSTHEEEKPMIAVAKEVERLEQENIELRERLEKLQELTGANPLPKKCENCSNFIQHYIRQGNAYVPAYAGHCKAGHRTRQRNADETCKAFIERKYGKNFI